MKFYFFKNIYMTSSKNLDESLDPQNQTPKNTNSTAKKLTNLATSIALVTSCLALTSPANADIPNSTFATTVASGDNVDKVIKSSNLKQIDAEIEKIEEKITEIEKKGELSEVDYNNLDKLGKDLNKLKKASTEISIKNEDQITEKIVKEKDEVIKTKIDGIIRVVNNNWKPKYGFFLTRFFIYVKIYKNTY